MINSLTETLFVAAAVAPLTGRLAFAGVFAVLIIWLLLAPLSLLGEDATKKFWATPRFWAIVIAAGQITVYMLWR